MRTPTLHFELGYFPLIQNHYLRIIHDHHYTSLYNTWIVYDEATKWTLRHYNASDHASLSEKRLLIGKLIPDKTDHSKMG
jgi:hypothetical protein